MAYFGWLKPHPPSELNIHQTPSCWIWSLGNLEIWGKYHPLPSCHTRLGTAWGSFFLIVGKSWDIMDTSGKVMIIPWEKHGIFNVFSPISPGTKRVQSQRWTRCSPPRRRCDGATIVVDASWRWVPGRLWKWIKSDWDCKYLIINMIYFHPNI